MPRLMMFLILTLFPAVMFAANTEEYTLSNGLKVIVHEDHRAPVVLSSVWYKVGGAYEPEGITGISHMLEHMMFRGTKLYGPGQFDKVITENGGQQNAMTTSDYTMYYETLPASKLDLAFKLESDRMHNLTLNEDLFRKEKKVVEEERRMRVDDNPQGITWEKLRAAALVNTPYEHPVVGWMKDIKNYKLSDLSTWYKQWYVPNNAVLVVVGDVNPNEVYQLAKKYFGPLAKGSLPILKSQPLSSKEKMNQVNISVPAQIPWLVLGFNTPSLSTAKEKWQPYALDVAAGILGGGDSSRLPSDIVRQHPVAVSASATYDIYDLHNDLFIVYAFPSANKSVAELKLALMREVDKLRETLVPLNELNKVRAQLIAGTVFDKDSLMEQAVNLGEPEMIGLSWRYDDAYIKNIEAVTPEQVQAVAIQFLNIGNMTAAVLTPSNVKESS